MSNSRYIDIPFGPFVPDLDGAPNPEMPGYLVAANNVYMTLGGYRGIPGFASVTGLDPVTAAPYFGAAHLVSIPSFSADLFIGAATAIYQSGNLGSNSWEAWENVAPGGTFNGPIHFASFDDMVIAVNGANTPVEKSINDLTTVDFAALTGYPTTGDYAAPALVARIRDHLVLGGFAAAINSIKWSAIGDPEDWPDDGTTDALSKESGVQHFSPVYGAISMIVGGEKTGLIFQNRAITRMTYVGGNVQFEFDTFEKSIGGPLNHFAKYSHLITGNGWTYFYCHERRGVFRTDGYRVEEISGPIREAILFDSLNHAQGMGDIVNSQIICAGADIKRGLLFFLTAIDPLSTAIVYNINTETWTTCTYSDFPSGTGASCVFSAASPILSMTRLWNINTAKQPQVNTGAVGSVTLQTGFVELDPGYYVEIDGAHLIGQGVPGSLALAYKAADDFGDMSLSQSGFTSMTAPTRGLKFRGRANAPYFAFRVTGTGATSQLLKGIRVYFTRKEPVQ